MKQIPDQFYKSCHIRRNYLICNNPGIFTYPDVSAMDYNQTIILYGMSKADRIVQNYMSYHSQCKTCQVQ